MKRLVGPLALQRLLWEYQGDHRVDETPLWRRCTEWAGGSLRRPMLARRCPRRRRQAELAHIVVAPGPETAIILHDQTKLVVAGDGRPVAGAASWSCVQPLNVFASARRRGRDVEVMRVPGVPARELWGEDAVSSYSGRPLRR